MSLLKLHGVPLSQPFRSVSWLLLINKKKFQPMLTVPGTDNKLGTKHPTFLALSNGRVTTIPLLRDGNFVLAESPAILSYLCDRYKWGQWYGSPGSERKALVDWYLHSHHDSTRNIARLITPYIRPDLLEGDSDVRKESKKAHDALRVLNEAWLSPEKGREFLTNDDIPSIADLLAYEEVIEAMVGGLVPSLKDEYPIVWKWTKEMEKIPFHKEIHVSLDILGNVTTKSDEPMETRLARCTKAGMAVLVDTQREFD